MRLNNPTLQLAFSNNETQVISDDFIIRDSIKFNYVLLSGMMSASNRVSLEIAKRCPSTESIISAEDNIKAILKDGNDVIFTGYISTSFSWTVTASGEQALKLTIEDVGTRLLQQSFIDNGYHLFNCTASTAIQAICDHCGVTVSDRCFSINNIVVKTVESHQTCKDILARMVYELGLVYYFDNLGELRLFEIATSATDNTRTLDDNDLCSLSMTKKLRRYRSSRVSYTKLEEAENYLVYRNITGKDDTHPYCNMTLNSKGHFDGVQVYTDETWNDESFVEACNAQSETDLVGSNKILAVTEVVPNFVYTGNATCTISANGPYLQIHAKNNSNSPVVISRLDAYGTIVYEKENAVIRTSEEATTSSTFEETLEYVHDTLTAKRFANITSQFNQYSEAQYSFKLKENLPLGTVVHISENLHSSLDVDVLLVEKEFTDKSDLVSYKAVGLSAFDLDRGVFTRSYKNPQISLKGSDGAKGIPGEKGEKGDKGDTGAQGDAGPKGDPFSFEDFTQEELELLKGEKGDDGSPAISAGLSINSLQIPIDVNGLVDSSLISIIEFEAYLGTVKQACTATIPTLPTGMSASIDNNLGKITLSIAQGSNLDNDTFGQIEVTLTCLGQSFTRCVSWVKSLDAKKIKQDIQAQANEIISLTSSLDSKASISDLTDVQTQIQEQNSSITSLTSDLANKALKSDLQSLEDDAEDNASAINGLATRVSSAEGTITAHGTSISQNADAIQSKASKSSVDTLSGTVTSQGTQITQTANSLSSLATRVTTAEGTISSHGTSITQNANAITTKASQSSVNTLSNTVTTQGSTLTQTVNGLSALTTRVTTAEGTLTTQRALIDQKADSVSLSAYATKTELATETQKQYPFSSNITVNGNANTFYPVIINGGDQFRDREILVHRTYGATAPDSWANSSTHRGSLVLKLTANFGGWGGADYHWKIDKLEECYSRLFSGCDICKSYQAFAIFLRGGGATYTIESSANLDIMIRYDTTTNIGSSGSTVWYAPAPRGMKNSTPGSNALLDTWQTQIDNHKVTSDRIEYLGAQIKVNSDSIELKATKTEVNTLSGKVTQNTSNISQNATNISLKVGAVDSSGNAVSNAKIEVGSIDGQSKIQLDADKVIINGSVKASKINVGDLVASSVFTESLNSKTITLKNSGMIKSDNYAQNADGVPTDGFRLDGATGQLKARNVNINDGTFTNITISGNSTLKGNIINDVIKTVDKEVSADSTTYSSPTNYSHFVETDLSDKVRSKQPTENKLQTFSGSGSWQATVVSNSSINLSFANFYARTSMRIAGLSAPISVGGNSYSSGVVVNVSAGQYVIVSSFVVILGSGCLFYNSSSKDLYHYPSHQYFNSMPSDLQSALGFTISSNLKGRVVQSAEVTRLTDGNSWQVASGSILTPVGSSNKTLSQISRSGNTLTFVTLDGTVYSAVNGGIVGFTYSYKRLTEAVGVKIAELNPLSSNAKIGGVTPFLEIKAQRVYGAVFN